MLDAVTMRDTGYSLAEAAVRSELSLSAFTLPDVLARPAVVLGRADPVSLASRKVVIRKSGQAIAEVHARGVMPRAFAKSVGAILDLVTLSAGWNSYSAEPVAQHTAIRAIRLLAELLGPDTPQGAVVPTVRGGIQLEWHTKGANIEVYVESSDEVSFFAEDIGGGETVEEPLAGHEDELRSWLQRISGE
jgi:hypothetical protein